MDKVDLRKLVRSLRLEGKTVGEVQEVVAKHTRTGTASKTYVLRLLEPTTEDPLTVKTCLFCKQPFETTECGFGWCSEEHKRKSEEGARVVSVSVDPEVWEALGYKEGEVTGAVVREVLQKVAANVRKRKEKGAVE